MPGEIRAERAGSACDGGEVAVPTVLEGDGAVGITGARAYTVGKRGPCKG